jgi:membrane-bound lytic murein transglycosylase D
MRSSRVLPALLAVLALLAPAAAHAQRDTIRLGGDPGPRDTITLAAEDTAPARPERPTRWSRPFAVEGSGEVAPRPAAREVVWLPADTVRARRLAARRDSAGADELASSDGDEEAATDEDAEADSAPPPARRAGSRTASRDTATTGRRTGRTTRADTTATRRSATRGEDDEADDTRPTRRASASRDTAAATTRRTTSRDTATTTRRSTSRDTAATRRAATRDTASRRATTTRPRTHRVASGETLFGIARRYAVTTAQIRALNPDLGETLETGTVLRLPAGARAPGQATAPTRDAEPRRPAASRDDDDERPAPARPSTRARRHTVAAGETLYGLSRRYGVTVDAIRRANDLEGDTVRPGQALVIPAAPPAQR